MPNYFSIVTALGLTKIAAAQAAGTHVNLTTLKAGDSGGVYRAPAASDLDVVGEVWTGGLNRIAIDDDNLTRLIVEAIITTAAGGFYVREAGVFDADGDLIVICNLPETYKPALSAGSGKDLYIKIIVEWGNTETVTLLVDPEVVMATRQYVDDADAVETAAREAAVAAEAGVRADAVAAEAQARSNGDATEAQDRSTADADLQAQITAEATARSAGDAAEALARSNADAALVPAGAVMAFALNSPPSGWLECNGSAMSRATYALLFAGIGTMYGPGDGSTTFNLPDYRGRFLRGLDHGAGLDPDAAARTDRGDGITGDHVGTGQADEFRSHMHEVKGYGGWAGVSSSSATPMNAEVQSGATGGNETRPVNINVLYCIKH